MVRAFHGLEGSFPIPPPVEAGSPPHLPINTLATARRTTVANMGEVIQFIPKSERQRNRLIREARAIYDGVFLPADPVNERRDKAPASHTVSAANAHRSDEVLS